MIVIWRILCRFWGGDEFIKNKLSIVNGMMYTHVYIVHTHMHRPNVAGPPVSTLMRFAVHSLGIDDQIIDGVLIGAGERGIKLICWAKTKREKINKIERGQEKDSGWVWESSTNLRCCEKMLIRIDVSTRFSSCHRRVESVVGCDNLRKCNTHWWTFLIISLASQWNKSSLKLFLHERKKKRDGWKPPP